MDSHAFFNKKVAAPPTCLRACEMSAFHLKFCRRVVALPTTSSEHLARVRPTLMRCSSATNPMVLPWRERTVLKMVTSFSRPCAAGG
jgi:hypothetical protein